MKYERLLAKFPYWSWQLLIWVIFLIKKTNESDRFDEMPRKKKLKGGGKTYKLQPIYLDHS